MYFSFWDILIFLFFPKKSIINWPVLYISVSDRYIFFTRNHMSNKFSKHNNKWLWNEAQTTMQWWLSFFWHSEKLWRFTLGIVWSMIMFGLICFVQHKYTQHQWKLMFCKSRRSVNVCLTLPYGSPLWKHTAADTWKLTSTVTKTKTEQRGGITAI